MPSEEYLYEHILRQAKDDYVTGNADEENFRAAARWLFSDSERRNGFLWVCNLLGLDAGRVREQATAEHEAVQAARRR